jgi:glutathione S-transferase
MSDDLPTLWHIGVSHYSEKARWALAHKHVAHRRRSPVAGAHMLVALWLTRGAQKTFPVLTLEGRHIGDSTAIIAALEGRYPEPALYPSDPALRRRALELEEFFDEELGPHTRLLAFHELGRDPERLERVVEQTVPASLLRIRGAAMAYARGFPRLRFGVADEGAAEIARAKIRAAFDRLEGELDANGGVYLVGDGFTVADLTAAALFYPIILPEEGPLSIELGVPAGMEEFRAPLKERPGYLWVEETFRRHRKPGRAAAASADHASATE